MDEQSTPTRLPRPAALDSLSLLEKRLFDSRESLRRRLQNLGNNIEATVESVEDLEHIIRFCEQVMTCFISSRPAPPQPERRGPRTFLEECAGMPEFSHVRTELLLAFARPSLQPFFSHSFAVAVCAEALYLASGADKTLVRPFSFGALLHDVGVSGISLQGEIDLSILDKNPHHTVLGETLLSGSILKSHELGGEIARTHHERWNGSGFPFHLSGDAIPFNGRVVAICDVFDTLMSRVEAGGPSQTHKVNDALLRARGVLFCPDLTALFCDRFESFMELRAQARALAQETLKRCSAPGKEGV